MTRPRVASSSSSWPVCASLKRPTAAARCVVCVHKSFSFGSLDIVAPVHYCHCRAQVCVENNSVVLENYIYRWTYLHRGGIPSISMMLFYFEVDERVRLAMAVPTCGFWTTAFYIRFACVVYLLAAAPLLDQLPCTEYDGGQDSWPVLHQEGAGHGHVRQGRAGLQNI